MPVPDLLTVTIQPDPVPPVVVKLVYVPAVATLVPDKVSVVPEFTPPLAKLNVVLSIPVPTSLVQLGT